MARLVRTLRQFSWILIDVGLLSAVYLLPPDTSLAQVKKAGAIAACVASARPPLVTDDPQRPGIDVELLEAIARQLGVQLRLVTIPQMGGDFDPRSWGLTRAQCAIIAGGLADSPQTRSYLETSPAYAETGWVALAPSGPPAITGKKVGVLVNVQGFNRVALARYLRAENARPVILRSPEELVSGLAAGAFELAVTEQLLGDSLADTHRYAKRSLPPPLERYRLVFGLWKGDLTLKRAVDGAMDKLKADGRLASILDRYGASSPPAS